MAERHTSLIHLVSQRIMLVYIVQGDLLKSHSIACKVTQVVPTHSIYVSLRNLIGKLDMMFGQEEIKVLVSNECSLLNDLRIDVR